MKPGLKHHSEPTAFSLAAILRTQSSRGQREVLKVHIVFTGIIPLFQKGKRISCRSEHCLVPHSQREGEAAAQATSTVRLAPALPGNGWGREKPSASRCEDTLVFQLVGAWAGTRSLQPCAPPTASFWPFPCPPGQDQHKDGMGS